MNLFLIAILSIFLSLNTYSQQVETLTGEFNGSGGLAVDKTGTLYASNFGSGFGASDGNNIYKINKDGTTEEFAVGFNGASGNAFDVHGNLYQSNINNNTVSKVTPEGEVSLFAFRELYSPVGVSVDSEGNVFVANCGTDNTGLNSITKITSSGTSTKFASSPLMNCPNGLTIDENNNLYTCNYNDGRILKITPQGSVSLLAVLPGANNSHLAYANNYLYVAKRCDNKIYKLDLSGNYELLAGTGERGNKDGNALEATINLPNGLAISPTGDTLYFSSKTSFSGACFTTPLNPVVIRMITGLNGTTGIGENNTLPNHIMLEQNYPNPFNPTTTISYSIPSGNYSSENVTIKVFDTLGRVAAVLVNDIKSPGFHEVEFNAADLSSGIYFYSLSYGNTIQTKKLTVLK